jgi:hypothetical protein
MTIPRELSDWFCFDTFMLLMWEKQMTPAAFKNFAADGLRQPQLKVVMQSGSSFKSSLGCRPALRR